MIESGPEMETRILICAPKGRDAQLIARTLTGNGMQAVATSSICELCTEIRRGAGAAVITEEAIYGRALSEFVETLKDQPPWSDLPVIILTTGQDGDSGRTWSLVRQLEPSGNISLLERPLRSMTLVSASQVALRARKRQYEVRALHHDLEKRVDERTAELRRLTSEAEGFSYTISHDLRAPLRSIIGTSHILLEDFGTSLAPAAVEQLKRQAAAAKSMANLIDDLLRLSRLSREEMNRVDFDYSELAHQVVDELRPEALGGGCTIEVQEGMRANGDRLLLKFALQNLIQNACKFSPNGGTVKVGQREDGAYYVQDQGIGFEEQYAKRVFLPFERLVAGSEFPGTGIGLANVKRIIDRHGGDIWAESELGEGATFIFVLESNSPVQRRKKVRNEIKADLQ